MTFTNDIVSSPDDFTVSCTNITVEQCGVYYISAQFLVPECNTTETNVSVESNCIAIPGLTTTVQNNSATDSSKVYTIQGIAELKACDVLTLNSSAAVIWKTPNDATNMASLTILRLL